MHVAHEPGKNAFAFANSKTLVGDESLKFSLQHVEEFVLSFVNVRGWLCTTPHV